MANDCLPQVMACIARFTRLDGSGVPKPGASNMYTTDALVQVQHAPLYEDADRILQKNACGSVCLDYQGDPSFLGDDITINLCTPDPQLEEMLSGGDVLTSGQAVGVSAPPIGVAPLNLRNGLSMELWARRIRNGDLDPTFPYAWWVFPKLKGLKKGGFNQGNEANLPSYTARAVENLNWFNGPTNNWPGVASTRTWQWLPVAASLLPAAVCGYQTVAAT